jgi:hypothetical protein
LESLAQFAPIGATTNRGGLLRGVPPLEWRVGVLT